VELHQLRYFCAVARAGNFTRAAEEQHIAQPSLSQQVRKLEDELGAKLFDRFPRFARLTEFGTAFLPKAGEILRRVGEARTEIQEMSGAEIGTVSVGAIPTIAPICSVPRSPALRGGIRPSRSASRRKSHRCCSSICTMAAWTWWCWRCPSVEMNSSAKSFFANPFSRPCRWGHKLAARKSLSLAEIRNEPFLLLKEGHCFARTCFRPAGARRWCILT